LLSNFNLIFLTFTFVFLLKNVNEPRKHLTPGMGGQETGQWHAVADPLKIKGVTRQTIGQVRKKILALLNGLCHDHFKAYGFQLQAVFRHNTNIGLLHACLHGLAFVNDHVLHNDSP
jgi:hypothetical protein